MSDLIAVYSGLGTLHDPPYQVDDGQLVEVLDTPLRAAALLDGARNAGATLVRADPVGREALLGVHDSTMLDYLESAYAQWAATGLRGPVVPDSFGPRDGVRRPGPDADIRARAAYYCRDTATPIVEDTWPAAKEAAAVALTAAQRVDDGAPWAYALCRPPGHHAAREEFSGFCYLNNAALAASTLKSRHGRVGIIDLDFHHGNGTQDLFWDDADVFYTSLHGPPDRHFPFFSGFGDEKGGDDAPGATLNFPMPDGTEDNQYLTTLERAAEAVAGFDPACLVVSLGLDIARTDPVGTFRITHGGLRRAGRLIGQLGRPAVIVQEGGYDLVGLSAQLEAFLGGLGDA